MDEPVVDGQLMVHALLQQVSEARQWLSKLEASKTRSKAVKEAVSHALESLVAIDDLLNRAPAPTAADFHVLRLERELATMREQLEASWRAAQEERKANANLKAELKEAQEAIAALEQDYNDAFDRYQAEQNKNRDLIERLATRERELESIRAIHDELETVRSQLAEALTQGAQLTQHCERLQTELDATAEHLTTQRAAHDRSLQRLTAEAAEWHSEYDRVAAERGILFDERNRAEAALQHQETEIRQRLARELGQLLVTLSVMAGQETSQEQMSPRRAFEGLKRILRNLVGGGALDPFPVVPTDLPIVLNPERESLETLLAQYDWEPAQPFADGRKEVRFNLITRGWRAGDLVLAKAVVMPVLDDAAGTR